MKRFMCITLVVFMVITFSACEKNYTHGEYKITIATDCIKNNKVGNDWRIYYYCDGKIFSNGDTVIKPLDSLVMIEAVFIEDDVYPDEGSSKISIFLRDEANKTFEVWVVEDNGPYDGNIAIWEVEVNIELVRKKQVEA